MFGGQIRKFLRHPNFCWLSLNVFSGLSSKKKNIFRFPLYSHPIKYRHVYICFPMNCPDFC